MERLIRRLKRAVKRYRIRSLRRNYPWSEETRRLLRQNRRLCNKLLCNIKNMQNIYRSDDDYDNGT